MRGQAYVGSTKRTFSAAVEHVISKGYGSYGGSRLAEMLSQDVRELIEQYYPEQERMEPGWMIFTGTKAEGKKAYPGKEAADYQLVTIAWPVLTQEDMEAMCQIPPAPMNRPYRRQQEKRRLIRLIEHGLNHAQGPVLLTHADLGLMLNLDFSYVGQLLCEAREESGLQLPTKGYYFDQGMRPTHKAEIIALYESGVDEADIARRSHHAPPSVGRYIRDYERVKLLKERQISAEEMAPLTGLQPSVVRAYLKLLTKFHPDLFEEKGENAPTPS